MRCKEASQRWTRCYYTCQFFFIYDWGGRDNKHPYYFQQMLHSSLCNVICNECCIRDCVSHGTITDGSHVWNEVDGYMIWSKQGWLNSGESWAMCLILNCTMKLIILIRLFHAILSNLQLNWDIKNYMQISRQRRWITLLFYYAQFFMTFVPNDGVS